MHTKNTGDFCQDFGHFLSTGMDPKLLGGCLLNFAVYPSSHNRGHSWKIGVSPIGLLPDSSYFPLNHGYGTKMTKSIIPKGINSLETLEMFFVYRSESKIPHQLQDFFFAFFGAEHDLWTKVTSWVKNQFEFGSQLLASWNSWGFFLVPKCRLLRFSQLGDVSPEKPHGS